MPTPLIKIDGTTVEAMPGSLNVSYPLGNRAAASVRVKSGDGSYRPVTGKDIEVFESASKVWAGSIDEVRERSITEAAPTGRYYELLGVSWEQYLDKRYCYASGAPLRYSRNFEFTADASTDTLTATAHGRSNGDKVRVKAHAQGTLCGGLSAETEYYVINAATNTLKLSLTAGGAAVNITDTGTLEQILITYRAGEIVTALLTDAATSEPLGTTNIALGAVIDTVIWGPETSVSVAIGQLAEASNYAWWIDEERELYFQPRTFAAAPFSISESSGNYRNFSMRTTREDKCNVALVNVDIEQIGYEEESFAGDGSTTRWTLANKVGQIVTIKVNDEAKEFAQWLVEADRAYYYDIGTTDIRQDSDETVLTAAETLTVIYRKFGANTIREEDTSDISSTATLEGASGIYEAVFDRPGITQVEAVVLGQQLTESLKLNVVEIEYDTDQIAEPDCYQLRPGQLQTISNSYFGLSSTTFLINQVDIRDISGQWLQVSVKAVSTSRFGGTLAFWKSIAGGGGTSGGGLGSYVGGGSSGTGGGSTNREYTLTANTTIPSPYTPTEADFLTVYVTQGAGPYTINFDSDFATGFNTNLPGESGAVTVFSFRGRADGLWWPIAIYVVA